jgi:hypothetical protein
MEREIMIGDLVRIAAKCFEPCEPSTLVGLVVGFAKTMQSGWTENGTCAKIEWTSGTMTVEGLCALERVQ